MIRLTYFTPTYNREKLLGQLYESLLKQTNKDFIWLIVDDGSKDNTKQAVESWVKENKIKIQYVFKENGGKNTAMDLAHQVCKTEFISVIDSDDFLAENCTDVLYGYFDKISDNNIVGLVGRRAHYDGTPFNDKWSKDNDVLCFYDISKKYGYKEDTILIFKTEIIKNYHFPKIPEERFITESVFYQQFLYNYKVMMIPECVYLAEYQTEGYTSQGHKLFYKNPKGTYYAFLMNAKVAIEQKMSLKERIHCMSLIYSWRKLFNLKDLFKEEFKFNWFYRLCGRLGGIIVYFKQKKGYLKFKENNVKN